MLHITDVSHICYTWGIFLCGWQNNFVFFSFAHVVHSFSSGRPCCMYLSVFSFLSLSQSRPWEQVPRALCEILVWMTFVEVHLWQQCKLASQSMGLCNFFNFTDTFQIVNSFNIHLETYIMVHSSLKYFQNNFGYFRTWTLYLYRWPRNIFLQLFWCLLCFALFCGLTLCFRFVLSQIKNSQTMMKNTEN